MAWKYSGSKGKGHPKGDFRTQKPKVGTTKGGWCWMQVCDEFINGRWEGFVSIRSRTYKSKAEALKNPPRRGW